MLPTGILVRQDKDCSPVGGERLGKAKGGGKEKREDGARPCPCSGRPGEGAMETEKEEEKETFCAAEFPARENPCLTKPCMLQAGHPLPRSTFRVLATAVARQEHAR